MTNARFLEFVDAGGYRDRAVVAAGRLGVDAERSASRIRCSGSGTTSSWYWRGMFELIPLPLAWPVYVSQAEASAYARWRGARLPTEAEFQRAAYGSPDGERRIPGATTRRPHAHGVFDFSSWDPEPAGSHPAGRERLGRRGSRRQRLGMDEHAVRAVPGFQPMASYPEYSADFFDGEHFVMKGASPATARELLRPTFRNWFRARYPYVYATFRCARSA